MTITIANASQNAAIRARRSVHQTSFLWAFSQTLVRSTGQRCEAPIDAGPLSAIGVVMVEPLRWFWPQPADERGNPKV